ncbi:hypothetical protein C0991_000169 [Blastosporella zonata]|nr:hypothetical protein C0991_000169 [Blastosporella zonata]
MRIIRNPTSPSISPAFARAISVKTAEPAKTAVSGTTNSTADPYSQFVHFHRVAKQNSKNLKKLAAQSAFSKAKDPAFQKKCATQLNAFHANVIKQQAAFSALEDAKRNSGKGLANYDSSVPLETILKDTFNLTKDSLTASYVLVKNIPILGPILGPILYDTKCLVETILNGSEELVDGTINSLPPFLKNLIGLSL